jgi:hypothetical protein
LSAHDQHRSSTDPEDLMAMTTAGPPAGATGMPGAASSTAGATGMPGAASSNADATGMPGARSSTADATGVPGDRPSNLVARWRDVAVGVALEGEEITAGLIGALRRAVAQPDRQIAELAERGALARTRGRQRAIDAVQAAVLTVATSSLVDRVIDAQLERVLRPVVLTVLDDVLLLLEREPDRIQALIRGQRESMVDELVSRIRTGAAVGDIRVDRLTQRMFRREPRPAPAPPAEGL